MIDAGEQRAESFALRGLRGGQRKSAHGAAVEAPVEGDELVALGGVARQLDGAFDGFGAGIAEVNFLGFGAGRDGGQFFREARHVLVIEIRAGHVDQFGGLLLNRGDNFGMAMAGGANRNACGEIEEHVAVDVFDHGAAAALGDQRVIARVGRRHEFRVGFEHALGVRTGQLGDELGQLPVGFRLRDRGRFRFGFRCGDHVFLLKEEWLAVWAELAGGRIVGRKDRITEFWLARGGAT